MCDSSVKIEVGPSVHDGIKCAGDIRGRPVETEHWDQDRHRAEHAEVGVGTLNRRSTRLLGVVVVLEEGGQAGRSTRSLGTLGYLPSDWHGQRYPGVLADLLVEAERRARQTHWMSIHG